MVLLIYSIMFYLFCQERIIQILPLRRIFYNFIGLPPLLRIIFLIFKKFICYFCNSMIELQQKGGQHYESGYRIPGTAAKKEKI